MSSAVTIDWVILCGAIVAVAVGILTALDTAATSLTGNLNIVISDASGGVTTDTTTTGN